MISRIVTVAVLSAGVALCFSPSFAQSGTTATGGNSVSGMGSGAPAPMSSSSTGTPALHTTTTVNQSGSMTTTKGTVNQAQSPRRAMRGDAAERQMTECLNNAAAQRGSFDSCKR